MLFDAILGINSVQVDWAKLLDEIGAAIAIVGSVVTVTKSLAEHSQSRSSLLSRRSQELDQVGKLANCYTQVAQANLAPEHTQLLQEEIQSRLRESVSVIQQLNLKRTEGAKDPIWRLGFWKKSLLWFKPKGWRALALLILAHASPVTALALLTISIIWRKDYAIGTAIAIVFTFIFRFWAFDEQRRQAHYRKTPGLASRLLLIQAPETGRMLAAQLLFFVGATLTIALLADTVTDWSKHDSVQDGFALLGLFALSMYASIFHGWAVAEHDYWQYQPQLKSSFHAMFRGFFRNVKQSGWPKVKLIFAALLTVTVGLGALLMAIMFMLYGSFLAGLLIAVAGALFVLITVYPASRAVRIRYALAEKPALAASASTAK